MMYLWPQAGSMRGMHRRFGTITTAAHRCVPVGIKEGRLWALDNECFRRPFDYQRWLGHWYRLFPYSKRCLFVVVPDKPFDARESLALWRHWCHKLRQQLDRFDNLAHVRKPWLLRPGRISGNRIAPERAAAASLMTAHCRLEAAGATC